MELRGSLTGIARDWKTDRYVVTFMVARLPDDVEGMQQADDLDIVVKRHKEKRSLNANAYFHVLAGQIASFTGNTLTHEKNRLIREYGQYEYVDGKIPTITMKPEYEDGMLDMESIHVRVVSRTDAEVRFGLMRGSHTYNTAEMARLIDGTVQEAKAAGIETLSPADLERMKAAWITSARKR